MGESFRGKAIEEWSTGTGGIKILLLGGVHGDESEGILFADRFIQEADVGTFAIPDGISLRVIPRMNPDGSGDNRRTNGRNVDLNRNMPTVDWVGDFTNVRYYPGESAGSEIESRILTGIISDWNPDFIISLHSYENAMVNFNGESEDVAKAMSEKNGLPPKGDIGYPTPGSLGTYAGWERNLPTITLEILRGQDPESVWNIHLDGILAALKFYLDHPLPVRKQI